MFQLLNGYLQANFFCFILLLRMLLCPKQLLQAFSDRYTMKLTHWTGEQNLMQFNFHETIGCAQIIRKRELGAEFSNALLTSSVYGNIYFMVLSESIRRPNSIEIYLVIY